MERVVYDEGTLSMDSRPIHEFGESMNGVQQIFVTEQFLTLKPRLRVEESFEYLSRLHTHPRCQLQKSTVTEAK